MAATAIPWQGAGSMSSAVEKLSAEQRRMWFLDQLTGSNPAYHERTGFELDGPLDVSALRGALADLAARHEILRTVFLVREGEPRAIVAEPRVSFAITDLTHLPVDERDAAARKAASDELEIRFDIGSAPPWRARLFQLGDDRALLVVTMHHIVSDGDATFAIFGRELAALYAARVGGAPSTLGPMRSQYAEYADFQRTTHGPEVYARELEHWRTVLDGAPPTFELPADRPRGPRQSFDGGTVVSRVASTTLSALDALAIREGADLFTVMLTAFSALAARYTGLSEVVVGAPFPVGREGKFADLIGYFGNPLVMRNHVDESRGFRAQLAASRDVVKSARANELLPFDTLVEQIHTGRDLSRTPLFQILFAEREPVTPPLAAGPLTMTAVDVDAASLPYDFIVTFRRDGQGGLALRAEYGTALYDRETAERVLGHLVRILDEAGATPEKPLAELSMLDPGEARRLLETFNQTDAPHDSRPFADQLLGIAHATPDAVAVTYEGASLTYADLVVRASRVANALRARGVATESLVAVCAERSLELIVAVVGVELAGAAYLPLDPAYPHDRIAFMLADAKVRVLVTQPHLVAKLPPHEAEVISLDAALSAVASFEGTPPPRDTKPESLAYVIYTSGSTGRPKGVLVTHAGIGNLVGVQRARFGVGPGSHVLQFSSLSFDASLFEIVMALLTGATLHLAPQHRLMPGPDLADVLTEQAITVIVMPPSALANLPPRDYPALRTIVVAGEACPPDLVNRWAPGRDFFNAYGPTEATVMASLVRCEPDGGRPSIGGPMTNVRTYVLDARLRPVPVGVTGELYLGGVGLARGYLDRPELSAERFVASPFGPGRLYRTGDLVRWLPNGEIDFLGRIDHQVKVRGFRIELGEIEATLGQHADISEVVAIVRTDPGVGARVVAYHVARNAVGEDALRAFARDHLPPHMVPSRFVAMTALPLTPNGKVDRKALPSPDATGKDHYEPPRGPVEEALARIWSETLGRRAGRDDDFFDLGGHSLLAVKMLAVVKERFGASLPVRAVFEQPTVAGLAPLLSAAVKAAIPVPRIEPSPRQPSYPLSYAQERIYFVESLKPGSDAYNYPVAFRLRGRLDADALQRALDHVVERHASLRTSFTQGEQKARQTVHDRLVVPIDRLDLGPVADDAREARAVERVLEIAKAPFELAFAPLARAELMRLSDDDHVLAINIHHIVTDGWSMGVFYRELGEAYAALAAGRAPALAPLAIQYVDFAVWQRGWLDANVVPPQLDYWKERLRGAPFLLELPGDRPRPPSPSFRGLRHDLVLPRELVDGLKALGRKAQASPFMTLLAGFSLLLHRYAKVDDILIGTPNAGRSQSEVQDLIGMFANVLVLRTDLAGQPTFRELLGRVRDAVLSAQDHQDVPFEKLVEELRPTRSLAYNPLVQVAFVPQETPFEGFSLGDVKVSPVPFDRGVAQFDLVVFTRETAAGDVEAWVEYASDLFDAETIARMFGHYANLLRAAVATPDRPISSLPMLADAERTRALSTWNDTTRQYRRDATLPELVAEHAERTPDAVAVEYEGALLTYAQLVASARKLAHVLAGRGVKHGSLVGVCLPPSCERVVAMLAVLSAGAAYVPLDPDYPEDRLRFMIDDAKLTVMITTGATLPWHREALRLDAVAAEIATQPSTRIDNGATAESLAYVVYTSGSTGTPKGVCVTMRGVVRLVTDTNHLDVKPDDRVGQVANIAFDAAMLETWSALLNGARLVGVPRSVSLTPEAFARAVRTHGLTTLFLPAPLFHQQARTLPKTFAGVRTLFVGGEALDPAICRRVLAAGAPGRLVNSYGPAECTVAATYFDVRELSADASSVPIGRPISNTDVYVLGEHLEPMPVGLAGEIYIGGDGVARGYLDRPELTAQRFLANPFKPGTRLYRTGDLGRYRADGAIEFLGRGDGQVKIRGYRIELGEIEHALSTHPDVREAVVVAREAKVGDKRLIAYVVPGEEIPTDRELRDLARTRLPEYMVPTAYVMMRELPLTPNMKVDYDALPVPSAPRITTQSMAPVTGAQRELVQIFQQVLGVEPVGVRDDFFELGGHSLLVTQVLSRVRRRFGKRVKLHDFFENASVSALSRIVDPEGRWMAAEEEASIMPTSELAVLSLTGSQRGFYRLEQLYPGLPYNLPVAFRVRGLFSLDAFEKALNAVLVRHDPLRATFKDLGGGEAVQIVADASVSVVRDDLSELPADAREAAALQRATDEARLPFDLETGPLVRARVLSLDVDDNVVVITVHHIAADGWSLGVLLADLATFYEMAVSELPTVMPELPIRFRDFVAWERQFLVSDEGLAELAFWKERLAGVPPHLALPTDRPRPSARSFAGSTRTRRLGVEASEAVSALTQKLGVTTFMVVLAAFDVLLASWAKTDDVVVGVTASGRTKRSSEVLVGCFLNQLPLRVRLDGSPTFAEVVGRVRESTLASFDHQQVPFEVIADAVVAANDPAYSRLTQVGYAPQESGWRSLTLVGTEVAPVDIERAMSPLDLILYSSDEGGELTLWFEYATALFDASTIDGLLDRLVAILASATADPDAKIG
jgi:amino acid adenylation domain-containing protein